MPLSKQQLKEILVGGGYLSPEGFKKAADQAAQEERSVEEVIAEEKLIRDETLGRLIADALDLPFIDLPKVSVANELLELIAPSAARAQQAVIFDRIPEKKVSRLATAQPNNHEFVKSVEKLIGDRIEVHYATPTGINAVLDRSQNNFREGIAEVVQELIAGAQEGNVAEMVDFILERAYHALSSDIHFNPIRNKVLVRFRVDGLLYSVASYPRKLHDRVVTRIKVLSRLRTDEKEASQDGRFDYWPEEGGQVNVRVSVIPVIHGENVVMRLLAEKSRRILLEETGLSEEALKRVKRSMSRPYGMILSVGPSGAGKTTTLYGMLQILNQSDVNIMTIEDPIEYNVDGVQQVQVNSQKDITFARGLRSLVRQDPDIMMVGEIRDSETAGISINSAMTGHLVLSTMHANDAATTFPRFIEMGVEPFLVASSVNLVISQRLVRRICDNCRQSYFLTDHELILVKEDETVAAMLKELDDSKDLQKIRLYRGAGCKLCHGSGYLGRLGIFEVLEVSGKIRSLLTAKASAGEIRKQALEEGMVEVMKDGLSKVLMGKTTLEEVIRESRST